MFRQTRHYVARLMHACGRFGGGKYWFHRRINWSYRLDQQFYQAEAKSFVANPDAYLAAPPVTSMPIADVWSTRLGGKALLTVILKVLAHWLFFLAGWRARRRIRHSGASIYRKCYVDDIELVFDPDEPGVVRAVFPFPINHRRQIRYLQFLRQKRHRFVLDGNPYSPLDLLRFLKSRNARALARLEGRAQLRLARAVVAHGFQAIQLSDEFDIGSLDFCRLLARYPVRVVNSAHGVGKYLPVHAYPEFHVLTHRQAEYYHATRPCQYKLRRLNDKTGPARVSGDQSNIWQLVFLSQNFHGVTQIVAQNEARLLERLALEFGASTRLRLLYRAHPNAEQPAVPPGFERLARLEEVNGQPKTVFLSFYSTCQIDPSFKGRKILVRGDLIYPEFAFDDSEEIQDTEREVVLLKDLERQT